MRCDPGPKYVQTLLRCQAYKHLPVLDGLARQPYFRESDGVLVVDSGYDSVSGILADFEASDYQIGEPTHEDAVAAMEALNVLIGEFHFATEADRSATLSAIFTATVRPGLPYAPAFSITASMPGSGKSFLARTIALFASPAQPTTSGYPATAEEASKAILAALMTGPPAIVFDDMQTDWKPHAVINRMLTSDKITDRILGASRTATVSTRVLLLGTGNNIEAVGDMTRRVITARLQPKTSTPFELTYDRDPVKLLRANRSEFVSYVLIIIRAWLAAGRPMTDVPPIASFEGPWSEYCRQPLLWLGLPTVAELSVRYLEYAKTYKRSYDIDDRYLRLHLLPKFGRLHLDQLDQTQIMDWLASKVAEGYAQATVNRWQVILSHMMRMAKKWGIPGSERNPLEGVKQKECNNQIERYITPAETARLKAAVEASPNTQLKYIVALLLLTGCRKRELLDARWEHFDIGRRVWRIPMSKTGKARHVPLSDQALAVLEQVPRFKGCDWLLPNPATLKPFTSFYNSWDTARRAAGLPDFRVHDCRHQVASELVNAGQSLYVVGKILGHAQAKTTERYAHLSQGTLLNAVNLAADASGTDWAEGA